MVSYCTVYLNAYTFLLCHNILRSIGSRDFNYLQLFSKSISFAPILKTLYTYAPILKKISYTNQIIMPFINKYITEIHLCFIVSSVLLSVVMLVALGY